MKTQNFTWRCLLCLFALLACQKQELNTTKDIMQTDNAVTTRDDACDHCMDDCCCFVELDEDDAASIRICGTTDGMAACSASTGSCTYAISGGGQTISLNATVPKKIFCMNGESGLRIVNISGSDNAGIIVQCGTSALPIAYNIAPQDSVKAQTNASCELADCN